MSLGVSSRPWAMVDMDLFVFENLIMVDYFSILGGNRLPDRHQIYHSNKETKSSLCSPRYLSFSDLWQRPAKCLIGIPKISACYILPGYPKSNCKVESAVKTAKRLLLKAKATGQDSYLQLLGHRNTPSQGLDTSQAQQLLSRHTKTLLPMKAGLLKPRVVQVRQELKNRQKHQMGYYNRLAGDLGILVRDDCVRV